ncbi:hypothetical protein STEG23_012354 [Scotinomys teguina]
MSPQRGWGGRCDRKSVCGGWVTWVQQGEPGSGMGSPGWAFILLQLWGLQGAVSLDVQQWPLWVKVTQGDEMSLFCGVKQSQSWERLRVEWVRDNVVFCHLLISNGSLNPADCRSWGQLSWWPPANFSLRLDHVSLNDSGDYLCRAILEIPKLQEAEGNGTTVVVEAENSFYSNVLYRPQEIPHKLQALSKEKDTAKDQRPQAIYFTTFPMPAPS